MIDIATPTPHIWTPDTRAAFLESLAASGIVRRACAAVGMSREAAYKLRNRRDGLAFRLGWDAALLIARPAIADELMDRAMEGQEDVVEWGEDRRTRTRRRHDNRLSLSLLGRLDRFAEGEHELHRPAQCIARDWDAYLSLVREGAGDAAVLAFLMPRPDVLESCQPATSPAPDAHKAPQVAIVRPRFPMSDDHYSVWWCEANDCFVTNFAPPPGFEGDEQGGFGEVDYERHCTEDEAEFESVQQDIDVEATRIYVERLRRAWFEIGDAEGNDEGETANRVGPDPDRVRESGTVPFGKPHDCIT